ncbi:MAG: cytochrome b/b6 domain-containing protein, partial [Pseudomonadota bacterium]
MAKRRYDRVAMALHWIIAVTIIAMLALAYRMVELPFGDEKFQQYQLHKSLGVTVLVATALRLAWRLLNPPPPPLASGGFERFAAQAGHWAFYGLMIGIPITGWLMVSASPWNLPTIVWGVVDLPHLPALAALAPEAKPVVEGQLKTV